MKAFTSAARKYFPQGSLGFGMQDEGVGHISLIRGLGGQRSKFQEFSNIVKKILPSLGMQNGFLKHSDFKSIHIFFANEKFVLWFSKVPNTHIDL